MRDEKLLDKDTKGKFEEERLQINVKRLNKISILGLVFYFILFFVNLFFIKPKIHTKPYYNRVFWFHIVMIFMIITYLILKYLNDKFIKNNRFIKFTTYFYCYFSLIWYALIAVYSQFIDHHTISYLIPVFIVTVFIFIPTIERMIMLFSSYAFFIYELTLIHINRFELYSHLINSIIFISIAALFSVINYKNYLSNFISKDIINKKSDELIKINNTLNIQIKRTERLYDEKNNLFKKTLAYETLRTNFFSNISHEFKTPINVILCSQQMLEMKLSQSKSEDIKKDLKYLDSIKKNSYRLLKITDNILDINKIESGNLKLNLGNFDIVNIVENISSSVLVYIEKKGLSLVFDTDIEEKVMACDPYKIERIILNLISNAIKFTKPGGKIFINIYDLKDKIKISVRDTGIGIPKDKQDIIFERFVQLDSSLSRSNEGSGIGLALVNMLVKLHNGDIKLKSEVGKGSEFIITLPVYLADDAPNSSIPKKDLLTAEEQKKEQINIEFSDIYF